MARRRNANDPADYRAVARLPRSVGVVLEREKQATGMSLAEIITDALRRVYGIEEILPPPLIEDMRKAQAGQAVLPDNVINPEPEPTPVPDW